MFAESFWFVYGVPNTLDSDRFCQSTYCLFLEIRFQSFLFCHFSPPSYNQLWITLIYFFYIPPNSLLSAFIFTFFSFLNIFGFHLISFFIFFRWTFRPLTFQLLFLSIYVFKTKDFPLRGVPAVVIVPSIYYLLTNQILGGEEGELKNIGLTPSDTREQKPE